MIVELIKLIYKCYCTQPKIDSHEMYNIPTKNERCRNIKTYFFNPDCTGPPPKVPHSTNNWNGSLDEHQQVTYTCYNDSSTLQSTCQLGLWTEPNGTCPYYPWQCPVMDPGMDFTTSRRRNCTCVQSKGWPGQGMVQVSLSMTSPKVRDLSDPAHEILKVILNCRGNSCFKQNLPN